VDFQVAFKDSFVEDLERMDYRVQQASKTVEILRCWDGRRGSEPLR